MPPLSLTLLIAFCLVLVIEGLLYALFPDQVKRLMAMALSIPQENLRIFGLLIAITGIVLIYLIKNFAAN